MIDRRPNGWACLCRFGGVGDDLIAAVALPGLKKKYGHVEVISGAPFATVFENNPSIDKLSTHNADTIPNNDPALWQAWFHKRSIEYDFLIHLSHSCETLRALLPTQTQFWWPMQWRREFCKQNYLETVLDICGLPHEFGPLFFPTDAEKFDAIETKLKIGDQAIAWVISGTRIDKIYPHAPQTVAQLVREVAPVVMLGAPAPSRDFELAKLIHAEVTKINGTDAGLHLGLSPDKDNPTWPIRRVLSFAQVCNIVIGPDTGPMWAVAFEPNAKVLLLSHASLENITKHWVNTTTFHAGHNVKCWPCHQLHDTAEFCTPNAEKNAAACIASITPRAIVQHTKGVLSYGKRRVIRRASGAELHAQHTNGDAAGTVGDRAGDRGADQHSGG